MKCMSVFGHLFLSNLDEEQWSIKKQRFLMLSQLAMEVQNCEDIMSMINNFLQGSNMWVFWVGFPGFRNTFFRVQIGWCVVTVVY